MEDQISGDLNAFLRDFMLDPPETFAAADRLVNEFEELSAAYRAVVAARQQDDRHRIDDRRRWVLGFDNREKLALYKDRAAELGRESADLGHAFAALDAEKDRLRAERLEQERIPWQAAWDAIRDAFSVLEPPTT